MSLIDDLPNDTSDLFFSFLTFFYNETRLKVGTG
jgi:hypothetical protein